MKSNFGKAIINSNIKGFKQQETAKIIKVDIRNKKALLENKSGKSNWIPFDYAMPL